MYKKNKMEIVLHVHECSLFSIRSDEGLTLETLALQLITVANLHFQLSWYNQIT